MYNFAIIGGDKRNAALAEKLFRRGHAVCMCGFVNYEKSLILQCKNIGKAVQNADFIIGPTPCSHNGGALNAPFHNGTIYVSELFQWIKPHQIFIAGYVKDEVYALAKSHDVHIVDMLLREELLTLNAIPTAEGAIKIAIEETDITLHGNHVMVIGYGRIGTILSRMLHGMGAKVSAVVDSPTAAALAQSAGYDIIPYAQMNDYLPAASIIFNTVPEILLDASNIHRIGKDTLVIDLASPPYGVDVTAARDIGRRVLFTNSLPGKVAPVTTADYIFDTVMEIIREYMQSGLQAHTQDTIRCSDYGESNLEGGAGNV